MFGLSKNKEKLVGAEDIFKKLRELQGQISGLSEEIKKLKKESVFYLNKIGVVRYNPFSTTGGNQSFSVAFLDSNKDGLIITGLFTSEGNRVYAKQIKDGKSGYTLSEEEKEAICSAVDKV
jgi:hypothetical protein